MQTASSWVRSVSSPPPHVLGGTHQTSLWEDSQLQGAGRAHTTSQESGLQVLGPRQGRGRTCLLR